ncbi:hypothetical protein GF339_11325 [candidate division KSB3 bacterium]|uniref:Flagellar assembly protein T N-terminal domain-containing protein n=1 Tax=candidate division KSB3 bacterium TaxID=2044937 RepID=A0A9D5Q692_9BACT|nr:hypothetical protein [candidate division KSB3 bacterium]MBD3325168.1 hypothetical protein [candidate division KSB3 bacterium]
MAFLRRARERRSFSKGVEHMKDTRRRWGVLVVGLLCLLMWGQAHAQEPTETVEAEGIATILQGNTDIARDNALVDAQRKAVEQAVGVLMSSESLVENYELVSDRILTRSAGYIQSYEILDERQEGTTYAVRIRATIGMGALEDDVEAIQHLIRQKGNPRMMFLIDEEISGLRTAGIASTDMSQAETVLVQAFLQAGFEVVDSATVAQNISRDKALKAISGDTATAAALGQQYGADVIITAKATASVGPNILNTSMKTHQAAINAKVIRADTGAILASATQQAKHAHIDDMAGGIAAIEKAATNLADDLIPQILEQWRQDVQVATTVQLVISDISFMQLKQMKELLTTHIRGVKEVYQRSFQARVAKLDVEIQSTTEALADELVSKEFPGLAFEITGMSENRIDLSIIK